MTEFFYAPRYTWLPVVLSPVWGSKATGHKLSDDVGYIVHAITLAPQTLAPPGHPAALWRLQVEAYESTPLGEFERNALTPAVLPVALDIIEDARMQFIPMTVVMGLMIDTRLPRPPHIVTLLQIGTALTRQFSQLHDGGKHGTA